MNLAIHTKAQERLNNAIHLLTQVYPALKEQKLLYAIAQNLHEVILTEIDLLLTYERTYFRIKKIPETLQEKLELFKRHCIPKHKLPETITQIAQELDTMIQDYKKSALVFSRKQKLVLYQQDSTIQTINPQQLKNFTTNITTMINNVTPLYEAV